MSAKSSFTPSSADFEGACFNRITNASLTKRIEGQLLYFKEKLVGPHHPRTAEMYAFASKLRKLGITGQIGFGPTVREFEEMAERHGLNANLNWKRIRSAN